MSLQDKIQITADGVANTLIERDVRESIKSFQRKLRGFDNKPTGDWSYKALMDLMDEEFGPGLTQNGEGVNNG